MMVKTRSCSRATKSDTNDFISHQDYSVFMIPLISEHWGDSHDYVLATRSYGLHVHNNVNVLHFCAFFFCMT